MSVCHLTLAQYRETLGEPLCVYASSLEPVLEHYRSMTWTDRYFPIVGQLRDRMHGANGGKGTVYAPLE
jgi:hypothetical protein